MYLLSNLVENYIYCKKHFCKRINYLYMTEWVNCMLENNCCCPSMLSFLQEDCLENSLVMFERIMSELGFDEINEEILYNISVEEYRKGYFESAVDFLYYKNHVAERLGFPYEIDYSAVSDKYFTAENIHGEELENLAVDFLEKCGIVIEKKFIS